MPKSWMYRTTFKRRMRVSFTLLTVFCIALTGLGSYLIASRSMEKSAVSLNRDVLSRSVNVLDQRLKQIIVASSTMMLNEEYRQMLRDVQAGRSERYFANFSLLQDLFTQAEITEKSIDSILISTPLGDFYPINGKRRSSIPFDETALYRHLKESPESNWVESHRDELFDGDVPVLSLLLQPLTDSYVPDIFLAVNVKENLLDELTRSDSSAHFLLLDTAGNSVLEDAERPEWTRSADFIARLNASDGGDFEYRTDRGTMLVGSSVSRYAPEWTLVSYLSKTELLVPVRSIQWLVLAITAISTGLALLLGGYLSGLLTRPLHLLRRTMKKVEHGDLSIRFQSPYEDEIGEVGQRFNGMLDQIGILIEEVRTTETAKRKAEVKALQAQIDPHFLYNTLNTIYWKGEMDEHEDVKQMVLSLSALFRLGLNGGHEITTLGSELEHVRQYLNLQQHCYEDLFDYEVRAEKDLLALPILKILLQPLVENSILHGLRERRTRGHIGIDVRLEQDRLHIRVGDNGSGMTPAQLDAANSPAPPPAAAANENGGGYALANIHARLLLYYGSEASLTFDSVPERNTTATLIIPFERGNLDE